jgi:hypothetical protein
MIGTRHPGQSHDRRALSTLMAGAIALVLVVSLAVGAVLPRSANLLGGATTASTSVFPTATVVSSTEDSSYRTDSGSATSRLGVTGTSSTAPNSASTSAGTETEAATTIMTAVSATTTTTIDVTSTTTSTSSSSAVAQWTSGPDHPTNESGSCAASGGDIYCVGGETSAVYFAPLSSSGVGSWTATTAYPINITGQSCVASEGYLYCVSGIDGTQGPRPTNAVYYAPLSPSGGLGNWVRTTDYPAGAIDLSCAATAGYVFCVGGANAVGTLESNAAFYAPISSSGVGQWATTTSYPSTVDDESCVVFGGFIDCIAGYTALGPRAINATYSAPVSSGGIGAWTATTPYPTSDSGLSCVTVGSRVYCIGGVAGSGDATDAVYEAQLSASGGIGVWDSAESYPTNIVTSCVAAGSVIACVSGSTSSGAEGSTDAVYYTSFS